MIAFELDPNLVRPGWTALIIVLVLGLILVGLVFSMRRQMRKINIPAAGDSSADDSSADDGSAGDASTDDDASGESAVPEAEAGRDSQERSRDSATP